MENQNNAAVGKKQYVNIAIKMRGFLQHDNNYFDRTCPSCGGMYSSYTTTVCSKCQQPLTYITTSDGKAMSISEGTFNPLVSKNTEERIERGLKRKSAVALKYRFKMFSFIDANGVLTPHPLHMQMKKGSIVEIMCINHPPEGVQYYSKKYERTEVELMHHIFERYGDSVKVIRAPKEKAESTIAYNVDAQGNPAAVPPPFNPAEERIKAMEDRLAQIGSFIAAMPGAVAAPVAPAPAAPAPAPAAPAPAPAPEPVAQAAATAAAAVEVGAEEVEEGFYTTEPSEDDYAIYDGREIDPF